MNGWTCSTSLQKSKQASLRSSFNNTHYLDTDMNYLYQSSNSSNFSPKTDGGSNLTDNEEDSESEESDFEESDFEERNLASGRRKLQYYWLHSSPLIADFSSHPSCAINTGIQLGTAQPASREHFNQHPIQRCHQDHPTYINSVIGCSAHRGVLNLAGRCYWCDLERTKNTYYLARALHECYGYRGP